MRVAVAMSGGVDSSVAAALLKDEGHEVIGITLKLWRGPDGEAPITGCCTLADSEDARRVAAQLDVPYYVLDYTDHFRTGVIGRFMTDYRTGRTPNPCIECNRTVKFSLLLDQSARFGCDYLATGHYARIREIDGRFKLLRGVDRDKDQSYVLSMLAQTQLSRVLFPIGEVEKSVTRQIAADLGLRTAAKKDSQDICFVGPQGYRQFLARHDPESVAPGPIIDSGTTVGRHQGVAGFTIGQRHGLGVSAGERRYVVAVDGAHGAIHLGTRSELEVLGLELEQVTWCDQKLGDRTAVEVQFRAHGQAVPGLWSEGRVVFDEPQFGIAPGQTAALYRGDQVLGSAIIAATQRVLVRG